MVDLLFNLHFYLYCKPLKKLKFILFLFYFLFCFILFLQTGSRREHPQIRMQTHFLLHITILQKILLVLFLSFLTQASYICNIITVIKNYTQEQDQEKAYSYKTKLTIRCQLQKIEKNILTFSNLNLPNVVLSVGLFSCAFCQNRKMLIYVIEP